MCCQGNSPPLLFLWICLTCVGDVFNKAPLHTVVRLLLLELYRLQLITLAEIEEFLRHFGCRIFYFLFKLDAISSCLLGAELRYFTLSIDRVKSDFIPTFIDPFILRRWCLRTFPQSQSDDVIFMVPFKGGATPPLAGPFRKPGCTTVGSQHKAATEHGKTSISS